MYSKIKTVPEDAIDELGHVNNVKYLQWVLEVSERHWSSTVPLAIREKVYWVVLNHFIEYKNPAFLNDTLVLKTWVTKMEGVRSERHVEIKRKKDDKIIVKAKTLWCLVDSKTLRPKRITSEIKIGFLNEPKSPTIKQSE